MTTQQTTIKTRSTHAFALVKVAANGDAAIVGYAETDGPKVVARAKKGGALLLPIADGRVVVPGASKAKGGTALRNERAAAAKEMADFAAALPIVETISRIKPSKAEAAEHAEALAGGAAARSLLAAVEAKPKAARKGGAWMYAVGFEPREGRSEIALAAAKEIVASVGCPSCGSKVDERCERNGKGVNHVHTARFEASPLVALPAAPKATRSKGSKAKAR